MAGSVARRNRNEYEWSGGGGWSDVHVVILDNYFIITSKEIQNGATLHILISRVGNPYIMQSDHYTNLPLKPLPLDCMGLGKFTEPPETRKEEGGSSMRIFGNSPTKNAYPFTVFHKFDVQRRYSFYARSEISRSKWYETFVDTLGVRKAQQDANKWFVPTAIDYTTFRSQTTKAPPISETAFTGQITSAATFANDGRNYFVVATVNGIYAAEQRSNPSFKRILPLSSVTIMTTLSKFGVLVLLHDSCIRSYNLHSLAGLIGGVHSQESFAGSMKRLTDREVGVTSFGAGEVAGRTLVVYVVKGFRHYTLQALEAVSQPNSAGDIRNQDIVSTFRPFGSQFEIPKEVYSVTMLQRTLAIATSAGMIIAEPTLAASEPLIIPYWGTPSKDSSTQAKKLRDRCMDTRVLGLVPSGGAERLLIYESFGCYITKYGVPTRNYGFIRWECPIQSFVCRGSHVLLVSQTDIEVRHIPTGRLIQVIEGNEIRLLQKLPKGEGRTLAARRGEKDDTLGLSDQLFELVETSALSDQTWNESDLMWEGWET